MVATEHDPESSISLAARRCRHPIDDFLLQHEVHVRDAVAAVQQTKQQRRRNVVGQVADDAQPASQPAVVEIQCIGFVDADIPELGMGVRIGYRSRGVGRALLRALIAAAKRAGTGALSLSVDPANFARSLYESEGFRKVGEVETSWTMLMYL